MSKSVALLLILVLAVSWLILVKPAFSYASETENTWVSKAPMQQARGGLGVAVVNGKIYAIGGSTQRGGPTLEGYNEPYSGGIVSTNEEYDPATDTWTYKASMPTPRRSFAIAVYKNKIYCIGGATAYSDYSDVNEVYDPATDTWETKASIPTARVGLQANVVDGKIYLIGGLPNGTLNEVYDPEKNTWTTKAPMPRAVGFVSAVVDNKIYAVGTYYNGGYISTTQIYDPDTNAWSTGAPPPSSISGGGQAAAAVTTGEIAPKRIYVFGVTPSATEPRYFVRVYDPENDSWTFGADPPTIRKMVSVGVVNDMLYIIGGMTIDWLGYKMPYATNEQYTPFGYGTIPPSVSVVSVYNSTANSVSLNFTVNKPYAWLAYSLDGKENVTINGNTTITGLTDGLHNITVYANDVYGIGGASETSYFTVTSEAETETFPTIIVVATVATAAVLSVGLLLYFKKRNR
jgi:N-acetylneuraminic acid mutarotase